MLWKRLAEYATPTGYTEVSLVAYYVRRFKNLFSHYNFARNTAVTNLRSMPVTHRHDVG